MKELLISALIVTGLALIAADTGPKKPERKPQLPRQYAVEVTDEALESLRRHNKTLSRRSPTPPVR